MRSSGRNAGRRSHLGASRTAQRFAAELVRYAAHFLRIQSEVRHASLRVYLLRASGGTVRRGGSAGW